MSSEARRHQVQLRIYGPEYAPPLVYLPGVHGDWTLIASFRKAIGEQVRFVEAAYPDTLTWSVEDYAIAVEIALQENGISHAWLLGESFSSQVVWSLAARRQFQIDGIIFAGGFVQHPARWAARVIGSCGGCIPFSVLRSMLMGYAKLAPWRFRKDPETAANIARYIAALTEERRQGVIHRLNLVAINDPCAVARRVDVPVFALSGFWDPIAPWFLIRGWLMRNCPALRDYKILWRADHNVLGTAPNAAAALVLRWMNQQRQVEL